MSRARLFLSMAVLGSWAIYHDAKNEVCESAFLWSVNLLLCFEAFRSLKKPNPIETENELELSSQAGYVSLRLAHPAPPPRSPEIVVLQLLLVLAPLSAFISYQSRGWFSVMFFLAQVLTARLAWVLPKDSKRAESSLSTAAPSHV